MTKIDTDALIARTDIVELIGRYVKLRKDGAEYTACCPFHSEKTPSFKVNPEKRFYHCFGCGEHGNAIDFLVKHQCLSFKEACVSLGAEVPESPASAGAEQREETPGGEKKRTPWRVLSPVPTDAPEPPRAHVVRGRPQATWSYRDGAGALLGVVYRFVKSDGGKDVLPCVYAEDPDSAERKWRWLAFPEPRPLYGLERLSDAGLKRPVLVVEGEKCADAAHQALARWFDVVSWPGGGKAVKKADWARLGGRKIVIWPDCDDKKDRAGAPIGEFEQPGWKAANAIAEILAALGCDVRLVEIPKPGEKPDGWDVADAVAEGLTGDALRDWVVSRLRKPAVEDSAPPHTAGAGPDGEWRRELIRKPNGALESCRENVYIYAKHHPSLANQIALDEFSNAIVRTGALPWDHTPGEWSDVDDLRMGLWLAQNADMLLRAVDAVRGGIVMAAHDRRVHPVRDALDAMKWDGVGRAACWVEKGLGVPSSEYARRAGTMWLIMMVARIYRPGCKADTVLVLEGPQGAKKSSALKVLTGEAYFGDTPFVMGDKDSFMALRGRWLYEIAELDSLNRAEVTRAKAFLSSAVDSYRAPYSRSYEDHPRQCVFAATTNQYEYLRDLTGNRRFWPILVGKIDLEWLAAQREQLFAEAVHLFKSGEPWWPEEEEFNRLFKPEIDHRMLDDPWISAIQAWLAEPEVALDVRPDGNGVSVLDVLSKAIKMEVSKIGAGQQEAKRVGTIMAMLGFRRVKRGSKGRRQWVYIHPDDPAPGDEEPLPV
ncbi:MAG: VapE family protein [Betaproteobacteria bacterium]|nr:VapE family protein [Betaproteobacteria bacterium]